MDTGQWRAVRRRAAAVAGSIALAALCGWMFGVDPFTRLVSGWAALKANTALAILALSVALWTDHRALRKGGAALAGGIAAASLLEWIAGVNLGIDELLFLDPASVALGQPPGRMAAATAIGLGLASFAVLAADRAPSAAQVGAAGAVVVGWVAMVGYAVELGPLWSVWFYGSVSFLTACALVLLGGAAALIRPDAGWLRVLTGEDAGAKLLRRLGPAAVLFPPASAIAVHAVAERWDVQIGFGLAIAATVEASVFLALLAVVAAVARAEEAARAHAEAAVRANEQRLAELARALLDAHEVERRNLARELHDELGQTLSGLALLVARASTDTNAADLARTHLHDLIEQVRSLALNLRPSVLDDLGLLPAVEWLVRRYPGLDVELQVTGVPKRYPSPIETAAFRITQEALTNVLRHARVDHAELHLRFGVDSVQVEVRDQGPGFSAGSGGPSTGLSGMRERAVGLGGRFDVQSRSGQTVVSAILPVTAEHE